MQPSPWETLYLTNWAWLRCEAVGGKGSLTQWITIMTTLFVEQTLVLSRSADDSTNLVSIYYIINLNLILDTSISVRACVRALSRSGYLPWILKWAGLESFGQRLISSIGKTKRIVFNFFFCKKKNILKVILWEFFLVLDNFSPV